MIRDLSEWLIKIFVTFSMNLRYKINMNEFPEFYNEHKPRLFNYLMRMTGDYELAKDIMQESFTRYIEHYKEKSLKLHCFIP